MVVGIRELTVEWGHCDPAGIVFNPRYFEWFDHSTACLFGTAGIPKYDLPKRFDIIGIPIVDTRAKFMVPSKWGDVLRIETRVIEFKRTSFDVEHQLFKADGTLAVVGNETRVWAGHHPEQRGRLKATPIPQEILDLFKA